MVAWVTLYCAEDNLLRVAIEGTIHSPSIVLNIPYYFLEFVYIVRFPQGRFFSRICQLNLSSILWLDVTMWLVLRFIGDWV